MDMYGIDPKKLGENHELWKRRHHLEKIGLVAAKELESMVNSYSREDTKFLFRGFADGFRRTHPTLQQDAMRGFLEVIRSVAENTMVDGRNRGTVELAKRIVKVIDEEGANLPYV